MINLNRKRKTKNPCSGCFLHKSFCICTHFVNFDLKTKLSLIIHNKETRRTTNTGLIATKCLINHSVFVRGLMNQKLNFSDILDPNYHAVLLYPSEDSFELNQNYISTLQKPINLIVSDGNWRQGSKLHYRYQELSQIPRVHVSQKSLIDYKLRHESKDLGLSTIEAIAFALGILENQQVEDKLLEIYKLKVSQTLKARGVKAPI
jgi:DTW domain-containing protein YfiP